MEDRHKYLIGSYVMYRSSCRWVDVKWVFKKWNRREGVVMFRQTISTKIYAS